MRRRLQEIPPSLVRVLDEDPALADGLRGDDLASAASEAVAICHALPRGTGPARFPGSSADMGLLILDGFLGRETSLSGRRALELLGPGDIVRPWDTSDDDDAPVATSTMWTVIQPARVAVLDDRFARAAGQWPALMTGLMSRAMQRSRWLTLHAAASAIPRLQDRLLLLLWLAADRWGRVTPKGVIVPITLTQSQLAAMAGARRPSVSTAMTALAARGLVTRERGGGWCLSPEVAEHVERLGTADEHVGAWERVASSVPGARIGALAPLFGLIGAF